MIHIPADGAGRNVQGTWTRATSLVFTGVCLATAALLVAAPAWPGIFTVDSQAILSDGISGRVSNWYAPLHSWLWGAFHRAGVHPGVIFLLATIGVVAGLFACYRLVFSGPSAGLAALATVGFPPIYGLLSWVGRDIWFLVYLLMAVAGIGWGLKVPRRRRPLFGLSLLAGLLATDARQNGIALLLLLAIVAVFSGAGGARWRFVALPLMAALALSLGLMTRAVIESAVVQARLNPEQPLMVIDLARMSVASRELLIPPEVYPRQDLEVLRDVWLKQPADKQSGILVNEDLGLRFSWDAHAGSPEHEAVLAAWMTALKDRPLVYLSGRLDLFSAQLGVSVPPRTVFFSWSDDLDWVGSAGLAQEYPDLNEVRLKALVPTLDGQTGFGGRLHVPWAYLLLGLLGAGVLALFGGVLRPLGWGLIAFQSVMQIGIFLSAPVSEYRYLHYQVVLGAFLTLVAARVLGGLLVAWAVRQPDRTPPTGQAIVK